MTKHQNQLESISLLAKRAYLSVALERHILLHGAPLCGGVSLERRPQVQLLLPQPHPPLWPEPAHAVLQP